MLWLFCLLAHVTRHMSHFMSPSNNFSVSVSGGVPDAFVLKRPESNQKLTSLNSKNLALSCFSVRTI